MCDNGSGAGGSGGGAGGSGGGVGDSGSGVGDSVGGGVTIDGMTHTIAKRQLLGMFHLEKQF